MKRTLGYVLSMALVGAAGAQTSSSGSGSQTGSTSQPGSSSQSSSSSPNDTGSQTGSDSRGNSQTDSRSQADQGSKSAPQGRSGSPRSRGKSGERKFHSRLKPSNDVNASGAGSATPSGTADFTTDGAVIVYEIHLADMASPPTAVEIHVGSPGDAGPVIVAMPLTQGASGAVDGRGTIDASQIHANNPDGSPMAMDDLVKAMSSGKTYVAVRTKRTDGGLSGPIESQGP
jgi:hypothetical protein